MYFKWDQYYKSTAIVFDLRWYLIRLETRAISLTYAVKKEALHQLLFYCILCRHLISIKELIYNCSPFSIIDKRHQLYFKS